MEAPLTQRAFEEALVRQCAPTLAGLKPAGLFTFVGTFALSRCDRHACDRHAGEAGKGGETEPIELDAWEHIRAQREAFLGIVGRCRRALAGRGVNVRVLAWRACGALVYAYRPAMLRAYLRDERVSRMLEAHGYDASDLGACLDTLGRRVAACACGRAGGDGDGMRDACERLPHEIGFFLGYPFEDVEGFIEHGGRDFICFGCWKVYANPRRAVERWTSYRRCTERYRALHAAGTPLIELAASRPPRACAAQARA